MGTAGHQEIEIKLRVPDEAALQALGRALGGAPAGTVTQVNHFLDTPGRDLDRSKHVLRVRDEDGTFFLTAKGPATRSGSGALTAKAEEEIRLDEPTARSILEGQRAALDVLETAPGGGPARLALVQQLRAAARGQPLARLGSFENRRTRWPARLDLGGTLLDLVFEMDRTTFPGGVVHHEFEVEFSADVDLAAAEAAIHSLLRRAGVAGQSAPSKAQRFFAALSGKPL